MIVDWADSYLGHPPADIQRLSGWLLELATAAGGPDLARAALLAATRLSRTTG